MSHLINFYYGKGVPQDYIGAVRWYRKSAEQGDANAQYSLSYVYHEGKGVPQDDLDCTQHLSQEFRERLPIVRFPSRSQDFRLAFRKAGVVTSSFPLCPDHRPGPTLMSARPGPCGGQPATAVPRSSTGDEAQRFLWTQRALSEVPRVLLHCLDNRGGTPGDVRISFIRHRDSGRTRW
jgi:hypothetical protein